MRIPTSVLAATAAVLLGFSDVAAAVPASAAPPKCSDLKGGLVGQNCVIEEGDAGYSLRISYPADYPDVQAVFDYVKQTRDGFVNVAKSPDARTMPYELEVTPTEYNSAVPPRGTQSVVFKIFQDVGGAHPQTFYKAFNWDQTLRWPIVLDPAVRRRSSRCSSRAPTRGRSSSRWCEADLEKQLGTSRRSHPRSG